MPGLLYSAYQKFYSALCSLDRFNKENSFFENISSLDTFFSEFRNVTFVMQKSLAHTDFLTVYNTNREKYLYDCKWFVEKRNETTKEYPFQLVKQIEITLYFPSFKWQIFTQQFTVEDDMELSELIEQFKRLFYRINHIEVFFSAKFSFHEKSSQEDLYDKLMFGLQALTDFLDAMYADIDEYCELCEDLKKRINEIKFPLIPRDMFLINDYAYYPEKDEFDRAQRVSLLLGENGLFNRTPLSNFNSKIFKALGDDYFQKFVAMHVIMQNTELLPTMMTIFDDNTFELDSFNADIKTTIYRKLNEAAMRIQNEGIKEIYYMQVYVTCAFNLPHQNMTSKERSAHSEQELLAFMKVDNALNEEEYIFEGDKLNNMEYIISQIINGGSKELGLGRVNMTPIIEAFKRLQKEDS
ncbi:hypothetical protein SDC9_111023 [bioreactor metagenome]|uniref:Uncharacterized protein n=1 Tax=bioreactor metagenome TaxID=1076179 RepID=A0A645BFM1_9ZZZZ